MKRRNRYGCPEEIRKTLCIVFFAAGVLLMLGGTSAEADEEVFDNKLLKHIVKTFSSSSHIKTLDRLDEKKRIWLQLHFYNNQEYPVDVDFLVQKDNKPEKVIYLLACSSLNFVSNFYTPKTNSLAQYFAEHGYLVVGITPREDAVPSDVDTGFMTDWDVAQHRSDIRAVIERVQSVVNMPYDVLGHSLSAVSALDYAAMYSDPNFEKVMILDLGLYDPEVEPDMMQKADFAFEAYNQLLAEENTVDTGLEYFRTLLTQAQTSPDMDSGMSRAILGLPGNFTMRIRS